jgi:hypothetical protein
MINEDIIDLFDGSEPGAIVVVLAAARSESGLRRSPRLITASWTGALPRPRCVRSQGESGRSEDAAAATLTSDRARMPMEIQVVRHAASGTAQEPRSIPVGKKRQQKDARQLRRISSK